MLDDAREKKRIVIRARPWKGKRKSDLAPMRKDPSYNTAENTPVSINGQAEQMQFMFVDGKIMKFTSPGSSTFSVNHEAGLR